VALLRTTLDAYIVRFKQNIDPKMVSPMMQALACGVKEMMHWERGTNRNSSSTGAETHSNMTFVVLETLLTWRQGRIDKLRK
jgi:hypothetical protein